MFSCNYNGWADVPEEEREGIDAFEAAGPPDTPSAGNPSVESSPWPVLPVRSYPEVTSPRRRAA